MYVSMDMYIDPAQQMDGPLAVAIRTTHDGRGGGVLRDRTSVYILPPFFYKNLRKPIRTSFLFLATIEIIS